LTIPTDFSLPISRGSGTGNPLLIIINTAAAEAAVAAVVAAAAAAAAGPSNAQNWRQNAATRQHSQTAPARYNDVIASSC